MRTAIKYTAVSLLGVGALAGPSGAFAADGDRSSAVIEEVVVTASKREQSVQDVPASVSALSEDFLIQIGAQELDDYLGFIPSAGAANNSFGERAGQNIIIRGISNTRVAGIDAGLMSATTGFYINNIPVTPVDTQLFDISRIEVLRGPQGTLYGVGSMGGAVKLVTNSPDSVNFAATAEASAGIVSPAEDDEVNKGADLANELNFMVNVPIIEGVLGARFVGSHRTRPGYIDTSLPLLSRTEPNSRIIFDSANPITQSGNTDRFQRNTNSSETDGLSMSVRYTPTDRLTIDAGHLWQREEIDDLSRFSRVYDDRGIERVKESHQLSPRTSDMTLSTVNAAYNLDKVSIQSDLGYYTRHYDEVLDFTQLTYGSFGGGLDYIPAQAQAEANFNISTYTAEVRIQSTSKEAYENAFLQRLDWVLGVFTMEEERYGAQVWQAPGWAANGGPPLAFPEDDIVFTDRWDVTDKNSAVFLDLTFDVTDHLILSGGTRFFDQETVTDRFTIDAGSAGGAFEPAPGGTTLAQDETGTTSRVNLAYHFNDEFMVYGSASEGFRLGGAVSPVDPDVNPECIPIIEENNLQAFAEGQFDSDEVVTYDLGFKLGLAGGRATVNGSVYRTDWDDLQSQVVLSQFEGSDCTRTLTANVGSAEISGGELEASVQLSENWAITLAGSIVDAEISDPGLGPFTKGDKLQNLPEFSASAVVNYFAPITTMGGGDFFFTGTYQYVDERSAVIGEPPPGLELDAYSLLGLRTGVFLDKPGLTVTLYIDNAFDEIVEQNATRRFGVPSDVLVNTGRPREIGLSLRKEWR